MPSRREVAALVWIAGVVAGLLGCAGRAEPPSRAAAPVAAAPAAPSTCSSLSMDAADLHVDLPYQVHYHGRPLALTEAGSQVTGDSLRRGRVRFVVLSLFLWSGFRAPRHTLADFKALLATGEAIIAANRGLFAPGGVAYVFSVEGSHALAGHESELPGLVRRGVRIFGLVHSLHNGLGDSVTDRRRPNGGLTAAGRTFVRAVYRAGGLIDVSHASDTTVADIAAIARELGKPLIATHSNARVVTPHPRNLSDDALRAIAASGGLVGVNFHSPFLRAGGEQATMADVVRHVMHMVAVMGPEHVAIGSDLDGAIHAARGLGSHAGVQALLCELIVAGLSPADVGAIAGGNVLRVLGF